MNIFAIASLLSAGIILFSGSFVFSKNSNNFLNRMYMLLSLVSTIIAIGRFGAYQAESSEGARFWFPINLLWPFAVSTLTHFALSYTGYINRISKKISYPFLYVPPIVIFLVELSRIPNPSKTSWGWVYEFMIDSPISLFIVIWAATTSLTTIFLCYRYYTAQKDFRTKQQAKFVFLSLAFPAITAMTIQSISGIFQTIIPEVTTYAQATSCVFIGYAILKYQLFMLTPATAAETILSKMTDFLIIASPEGIIQRVNPTVSTKLGYKENEVIGNPLSLVFTDESVNSELFNQMSQIKQILTSTVQDVEMFLQTKTGQGIPVSLSTSIIKTSSGNPIGILCLARDITERKDLEERKSAFIEITSHELRTPLTSLLGYSEILKQRCNELTQTHRDQCIDAINRNAQRIERLIEGVSTVGLIERGLFQIDLIIDPMTEPIYVEGDKERLNQVLVNLLENAIKQTSADLRQITITTEIRSSVISICVTDNGAGIATEDLGRIFDQFISIQTVHSIGGSGLGLYISNEIIEAHGGTLTVMSAGKGYGSSFFINLPRIV